MEFPGQVLRYEDNFDTTSNLSVMITPTDKKSITDFGPPEEFLSKVNIYIYILLLFLLIKIKCVYIYIYIYVRNLRSFFN